MPSWPLPQYSWQGIARSPGFLNVVVNVATNPGTSITYYDYPASLAGAAFQVPVLVNDPKANQTYKTFEVDMLMASRPS